MTTRDNRDLDGKSIPIPAAASAKPADMDPAPGHHNGETDRHSRSDPVEDTTGSSEPVPFSRALMDKAVDLFNDRKFSSCILLAEDAYNMVRKGDSHAVLGEICLFLAKADAALGDVTAANQYLHQSLAAFARSDDRDAEADAFLESAPIFVAANRIEDARIYLEKGLNLVLSLPENNERIFKYYQFLALVNLQEGSWRDAFRCAEQSQVFASKLTSPRFRNISLLTVARIFMVQRKFRTALTYLDKALPVSRTSSLHYETVLNLSYRASMAIERKDEKAAESYFRQVSRLLGEIRGKKEASWNLTLKSAELDLLRSEQENARSRLESVIGDIKAAGYRHFDADVARLEARIKELDGDTEGALAVIDRALAAGVDSPALLRHLPLLALKARLLAGSDRFRARTILFRVEETYKMLGLDFRVAETLLEQAGLATPEAPDTAIRLAEKARDIWRRFAMEGEIETEEFEKLSGSCDRIETEAARTKQERIRKVAAILAKFGRTDAPIKEVLTDAADVFLREAAADRFFVAFKKPGEGWSIETAVRVGASEAKTLLADLAGNGSLKQPASGEEKLLSGKYVSDYPGRLFSETETDENIETGFYWIFPLLEGTEVIGYLFFSRTGANRKTATAAPVEGIYPVFVYWVASLLRLEMQRMKHRDRPVRPYGLSRFVGVGAELEKVKRDAKIIASSPLSVLVTGESGTGRKLLARAIHEESPRAAFPLVNVDCGSIGDMSMEQVIFGFGSGVLPEAPEGKPGLFEQADGGTVFFDEIGNMPTAIQMKLLRVIEEKEIRRIGEVKPRKVDIRIITATSLLPEEAIQKGSLEAGLYYRLKQFVLRLPPLRERTNEIAALADHFLELYAREFGVEKMTLSPACIERLTAHPWPGNVRELKNCLYHAQILSEGKSELDAGDLPLLEGAPAQVDLRKAGPSGMPNLDAAIADFEKDLIAEALTACSDNRREAANRLGISLRSLYHKIKKYGLSSR